MSGDTDRTDDSNHFSLPPAVLYFLLAAAGLGGGGIYGVVGPQLEKKAIEQCFDNSETALAVVAQHGQELLDLRQLLYQRTAERYTSADAAKDRRDNEKVHILYDRRITALEREMDTHSKEK